MKKFEKHGDTICLILLTIIGLIFIALTYAKSFYDGRIDEQNSIRFDISKFGIEYCTYCINSLILYSYMKIRKLQQYKTQRKTKQLLKIDEINKIILPSNSIPESVQINMGGGYVKYDMFYNKYNRKIKQIAILNAIVCFCGIIPYIYYQASVTDYVIFVVQTLAGILNIVYILLNVIEQTEINFLPMN